MTMEAKRILSMTTKSMATATEKWAKVEPTLGEVSTSVATWMNDTEKMSAYDELEGPSLEEAKTALRSAYSSRDDKKAAIAHAKAALTSLKAAQKELEPAAKYYTTFDRMDREAITAKSIGATEIPHNMQALYNIKRVLEAATNRGNLPLHSAQRVKSMLAEIRAESLPYEPAYQNALQVDNLVSRASSRSTKSVHSMQMVRDAIKLIDTMAANSLPEDWQPSVKADADAISQLVDKVEERFYYARFQPPSQVIPQLQSAVKALITATNSYDGYRLKSLANNAMNKLIKAKSLTDSNRAGWDNPHLSQCVDSAIGDISEIKAELVVGNPINK